MAAHADPAVEALPWQLERLKIAGFDEVEILHKNGPFAAFGARVCQSVTD
jgi:hypothetical protein